jgi:hypothetical protein
MTLSTPNPTASLYNAARRLRYCRTFPIKGPNGRELSASEAFDCALRILLDEHLVSGSDEWRHLYEENPGETQRWRQSQR